MLIHHRTLLAGLALITIFARVIVGGDAPSDASPTNHDCCAFPNDPPKLDAQQASASVATRPVGVAVSGQIAVSSDWSFQKPDLTRAVAYLASHPSLDPVASEVDHVTLAQQRKQFIPNFAVVSSGTILEFPNWDDFDHNVFSRSAAAPAFDLDRYPKGQSKSRRFEKVGVVQVFCNIHPQMRAIIVVTPNVYFARSDAEGRFEIKGVPPGDYEVLAWHERCGERRQELHVGEQPVTSVEITLEENRKNIIESKPRRDDYGDIESGLGVKRERLGLPVVKESHPAPDAPPEDE